MAELFYIQRKAKLFLNNEWKKLLHMQIKKKTDKLRYSIFNLQYRLKINIHNKQKTKNKKHTNNLSFSNGKKIGHKHIREN